jgi:hypothetical protein
VITGTGYLSLRRNYLERTVQKSSPDDGVIHHR